MWRGKPSSPHDVHPESRVQMSTFSSHQRAVLLKVSDALKKEEVSKLLFLCGNIIPKSVAENIHEGFEVFEVLIDRGKISSVDCTYLKWLLERLQREDLVKTVSCLCTDTATLCTDQDCDTVQMFLEMDLHGQDSACACACASDINDDKFMMEAIKATDESDDNNTRVGAVLVSPEEGVISHGCNRFPKGCKDKLPHTRKASDILDTKYPWLIYAVEDCLLPEGRPPPYGKGCVIYTTLYPWIGSAKCIISSGVKEVVYIYTTSFTPELIMHFYMEDKYPDKWYTKASKKLLPMCGILVRQHVPKTISRSSLPP